MPPTTARWEILVRAGDPADPACTRPGTRPPASTAGSPARTTARWTRRAGSGSRTDQGGNWKKASGGADGVWAAGDRGRGRGTGRMFFRVPVGAEMCGPRFTPDGKTLFVAVQHPATDGTEATIPGFERSSTFEDPATRWPDFQAEHAAAPVRGRHHQGRRWRDRRLRSTPPWSGARSGAPRSSRWPWPAAWRCCPNETGTPARPRPSAPAS
jgi:secreted PhoX family phosphatase